MKIPGSGNKPLGKQGRIVDMVFQISVTFACTVLAGVFGGIWLDNKLGTTPIFLLIGVLWGVGGGTWWLVLKVKQFAEESENQKTSGESS